MLAGLDERTAIVARYLGALFAQDVETALAWLHPRWQLVTLPPGIVVTRDRFADALGSAEPGYDHLDLRREFDEPVLLAGGRVFVVARTILTWRETAEHAATIDRGALFVLEDGLITEHRILRTRQDAPAAG